MPVDKLVPLEAQASVQPSPVRPTPDTGAAESSASTAAFFATNVPRLVTHFTRLTGDRMLAEDLVQEGCVVVLNRFGSHGLTGTTNPRSYLFGVVRRLYLGKLRKERAAGD